MGGAVGGIAGGLLGGPVGALAGSVGGSALGGAFGGGGGQAQNIPYNAGGPGTGGTAYAPQGQSTADYQYQNLVTNLYNTVGGGGQGWTPADYFYPLAQGAALNIGQNPYFPQALAGAQTAGATEQGLGQQATGVAQDFSYLPQSFYGLGQQIGGLTDPFRQLAGLTSGQIVPLQQAGQQLLQTGYDPQNALYQDLLGRAQQNAQAANAAAGLGSSPYGAGLVGDAMSNFQTNWENQQLARQAQALQGYGAAAGQAGNLSGLAGNQLGQIGGLLAQSGNAYGQIAPTAQNLLSLGMGGQQAAMQGAALPYQTSIGASQAALPAYNAATNLGLAQYTLPQQILNDLQSYLKLGQAASGISGVLGNLGFNQQQQQLGNLGGLLGAGNNALFGSQGLSGALGLNPQTGLLGGLSNAFSGLGGGSYPTIGAGADQAAIDAATQGGTALPSFASDPFFGLLGG